MTDSYGPDEDEETTTEFWDWSMEIYSRPGVAEPLLRLQDDFDLDVNLALWCLWAGGRFAPLDPKDVRGMVRMVQEWSSQVTQNLRAARRWMKGRDLPAAGDAAAALRNEIKAMELRAERICQDMLYAATCDAAGDGAPVPETAFIYFRQYLETLPELSENGISGTAEDLFRQVGALVAGEDTRP